ncbi:MAG: histidine kinase [Rhodobacteraceae bacterium]|nr:histidine kinase [Paracoccaceae bacterium]
MSGKRLMIGLLAFAAVFAAALVWFQFFAFYESVSEVGALTVAGRAVPVDGYEGIDASSSPLKRRGCFRADPAAFAGAAPAPEAEPLVAPFWFRCFDARALSLDLDAGRAAAFALATDAPEGFDTIVALYPDGRGYLWRQLNDRYRN